MKRLIPYILILLCGCQSILSIEKGDDFTVTTLPYRTYIQEGETKRIDFTISSEGTYKNTVYSLRLFQSEGDGTLVMDDGRILKDNLQYILTKKSFSINFISASSSDHLITLYFSDNLGHSHTMDLSFQNKTE